MTSADACHADLGLAAVSCPDEVLTQLQKVSVATLFQILNRLGFQRTYLTEYHRGHRCSASWGEHSQCAACRHAKTS